MAGWILTVKGNGVARDRPLDPLPRPSNLAAGANFLLGSLWVAIGCTPATLTGILMPFSDDRVPPVCPLAKKKEVTVCVVTNFAGLETRLDMLPAANELAELFAQQLRKRADENRDKIKVMAPSKTRNFASAADFTGRTLQDIGKQCKADYVISLEITGLDLYERKSAQMLYRGNADINVRIVGNVNGRPVELTVPASPVVMATTHQGLPSVWARMKIADLTDRMTYESNEELPGQIKQVALDYGLMSAFTAFVAVDSTHRTEGQQGTTVPVAVPVPEGAKYETGITLHDGAVCSVLAWLDEPMTVTGDDSVILEGASEAGSKTSLERPV